MLNIHYVIGDKVVHGDFAQGEVVRLNMSGPVVKFEKYIEEMCCPEYTLSIDKEASNDSPV